MTQNDEQSDQQQVPEPPANDDFGQFGAFDDDKKEEVAAPDVVEDAFGDFDGNKNDEPSPVAEFGVHKEQA